MSFDLKLTDGQLKLKSSGDLDTVFNTDKLVQDVTKIAITPMGANRLHSWFCWKEKCPHPWKSIPRR